MYSFIKSTHSLIAYVVLLLLLVGTVIFYVALKQKKDFSPKHRVLNLVTVSTVHLQALFGLLLYALSPLVQSAFSDIGSAMKNSEMRYFFLEHTLVMLLMLLVITLGNARAKRANSSERKVRISFRAFFLALLLCLTRIPWERLFSWF